MSTSVERDVQARLQSDDLNPLATPFAVVPIGDDCEDRWGGHALPSDHPAWMKDTLSLSQRARALLAKLKPAAVKVIAYWEHKVRSIVCAGRRISVDASGSYRLD